jgi:hypothetical protein
MSSPKTIADMEFEKMYDETGKYLQQQLTFASTTQSDSNTLKKPKKANSKRVSFIGAVIIKVKRLHETDSERENLWWPASNKIDAAASKCMERFWKTDNIYRWTIDEEAWLNYDINLTLAAARASWAKRNTALNEDSTSELPTVSIKVELDQDPALDLEWKQEQMKIYNFSQQIN